MKFIMRVLVDWFYSDPPECLATSFVKVTSTQTSRQQARMSALILKLRPRPLEEFEAFCRRRGRAARAQCRGQGLWSDFWFSRAVAWDDHMTRHLETIATVFRNYRDITWLEARRSTFANVWSLRQRSWTPQAGRTGTRAAAGFVAQRWQSGINFARMRGGA